MHGEGPCGCRPAAAVLLLAAATFALLAAPGIVAQETEQSVPKPAAEGSQDQAPPAARLKVTTRLVIVDVVATDKDGNPVLDLRPGELEVYEENTRQQILNFWLFEKDRAEAPPMEVPPGVYTNWIAPKIGNAPPTILLLDGLNTPTGSQTFARTKMLEMIKQLPPDTPIAVFALSRQLLLLQDFTRDPQRLQLAIDRALNPGSDALIGQDHRDDPNSATSQLEQSEDVLSSQHGQPTAGDTGQEGRDQQLNLLAMVKTFMSNLEADEQAARTDTRVYLTLAALSAVARYSAGYQGRKNLVWVSASFPLSILPQEAANFRGTRNYGAMVEQTTRMLTDAQVAIYPVNAGGVQAPAVMDVTVGRLPASDLGPNTLDRLSREFETRMSAQDSMQQLADQTGGTPCLATNRLGDCVLKAIEDSNSYYLLGYRPAATDRQPEDGGFRRIEVKTTRKGVRLRYRRGYFPGSNRAGNSDRKDELKEAVISNPWQATQTLLVARPLQPQKQGEALYHLAIDGQALTFVPVSTQDESASGGENQQRLTLEIAVGMFDADGKLLYYTEGKVEANFSPAGAEALRNQGYPYTVAARIPPKAARMRMAVRDSASGAIGTVDVPVDPRWTPTEIPNTENGSRH